MNLLSNAIDAMEQEMGNQSERIGNKPALSNPTITIRTSVIHNNWVAIAIADNGIGISEEIRSQLFDPFFTTKGIGKGTGLGLSISYQIITQKHGGKIYCDSTLGQGTEFVVQIPVRQAMCQIA